MEIRKMVVVNSVRKLKYWRKRKRGVKKKESDLLASQGLNNKKKGKKKGKKGKVDADDEEIDEPAPETPVNGLEEKKPVEMTAEELADEEWGPVKEKKGKKGKKGKKDEDDVAGTL